MEINFAPLFSGSSGNATYVGCEGSHVLVDAGVSGTRVIQELRRIDVDPASLKAILVTHEHADHIRGIGILSRKFDIPIYATAGTWAAMEGKIGEIAWYDRVIIDHEQDFYIGRLGVQPFPTSHDAADPVGFYFFASRLSLSIATDLGCVQKKWLKHVMGSDVVILESNYDPNMLLAGPYPYALQRRIMGKHGHLSNEEAADVAVQLAQNGARMIVLAHLSKENNTPDLALQCCECAMRAAGIDIEEQVRIIVARRDENTGMYTLS